MSARRKALPAVLVGVALLLVGSRLLGNGDDSDGEEQSAPRDPGETETVTSELHRCGMPGGETWNEKTAFGSVSNDGATPVEVIVHLGFYNAEDFTRRNQFDPEDHVYTTTANVSVEPADFEVFELPKNPRHEFTDCRIEDLEIREL